MKSTAVGEITAAVLSQLDRRATVTMRMANKKDAGSRTSKKGTRSTQVPGQFYGYTLQITRAVAHLLRARQGQAVSVEHLDDVATVGVDGIVSEQDKSGLAHNPVSDYSVELWKTLHLWVRAVRGGALQSGTSFVLYVAQDHHGNVIDRIHETSNKLQADALVRDLRIQFWGMPPAYAARSVLAQGLAEHVNGVLSASDDALSALFMRIRLENGSGAPVEDLGTLPGLAAISPEAKEKVIQHLLGWVKRMIDKCIENKQAPILQWVDFQKQLVSAARKFDRSEILASSSVELSQAEVQSELHGRTYVRQLQVVNCPSQSQIQAVHDFLRSAIHRTTWSETGDVLEGSFEDFDGALVRAWQSQQQVVEIEHQARNEMDRGRLLYLRCTQLRFPLQGMEVPDFFVPGSFHTLSDTLRLGWHPRYQEAILEVMVPGKGEQGVPTDVPAKITLGPAPMDTPTPSGEPQGESDDTGNAADMPHPADPAASESETEDEV